MGRLGVLPKGRWSAHAALKDCMDSIRPEDKVLVLVERVETETPDGEVWRHPFWSANATLADAAFMMSRRQVLMFVDDGEE